MPKLLTLALLTFAIALDARLATTTTLTASTTTPAYGAGVTFTATVTGDSPNGTVTFVGNTYNTLEHCTLSGGECRFSIGNLIPGQQSFVAKYGGDSGNLSSDSSPLTVTVGGRTLRSTTTTMSVSRTPGSHGPNITLIARVSPASATGLVTFKSGSTVLGSAFIAPATGSGIPTSLFGLTVGSSYLTPAVNYKTVRSWDNEQNISWSANNPSEGAYRWTNLDAWVAANSGKDMIYTFGVTPQWASLYPNNPTAGANHPEGCAAPASLNYWDKYLTAVATRYPQIKYWEVWNEPNDFRAWCGATSGSHGSISTLAVMSRHASSIIKAINPAALILAPATNSWYPGGAENGAIWMSTFLADGGVFDIFAFHGYIRNPGMAEDEGLIIASIQSVMAEAGISMPIWDTEAGWYTDSQPILAPARQLGFMAKAFIVQQSLGVARSVWYMYHGAPEWGQMYNTSTGDNANVLAYDAVYNWLTGATLSGPCSFGSGAETCNYTRPGGYQAQAVWETNSTGSSYSYRYPAGMTQYLDVTGVAHALSGGKVMIGDAPILLENGNIPAYSASLSITLPTGADSLTATYGGDTYDAVSTSSTVEVVIEGSKPRQSHGSTTTNAN